MWAGGKDQEFSGVIFLKILIVWILMKMSVRLQAEGCPDTTNMETLYRVPFLVLECSNLMLKKPPWVHTPSAVMGYAVMVVSYFLITGGIIYDVSREPPSVGAMTDEHGLPLQQSTWTVYYGSTRIQLPVYNGRFRFHNPRPIPCTKHSKTQSISSPIHWIHLCAIEFFSWLKCSWEWNCWAGSLMG